MAIKNGKILNSTDPNVVLGANYAIYDKNGNDIATELDTIKARLDKLEYKQLDIETFAVAEPLIEVGTIVTDVLYTWTFSEAKNPASLTLRDAAGIIPTITINPSLRAYTLSGLHLTDSRTWILKSVDAYDHVSTAYCTTSFANRCFWGAAPTAIPSDITNQFIQSLSNRLTLTHIGSVDLTVNEANNVFYACPARMPTPIFYISAQGEEPLASGGMSLLVENFSFTNSAGYAEYYNVWMSDYPSLGNITMKVN